ncbi:MAG: alpha/beta hydrolase, partial [Prevotella sp.]
NADERYKLKLTLNAQRTEDYHKGTYAVDGGVIDPVPDNAPTFVKRYHDFYKTSRGYQKRSPNSNNGKLRTVALGFLSHPLLSYIGEIRNPVMIVHGSEAHSLYFSKDAYKQLTGDNKELVIIDGADHTDLYDNLEKIPFDRIDGFFKTNLIK